MIYGSLLANNMHKPTIILRHRKENLKKCSLRGLEKRKDFLFLTYPTQSLPNLTDYFLLDMHGEELTEKDSDKNIFLIDSTWKYLEKILKIVPKDVTRRKTPKGYKTAYPRKQTFCEKPDLGLASIEALYITYKILNRDVTHLLDNYHWKQNFLEINNLGK